MLTYKGETIKCKGNELCHLITLLKAISKKYPELTIDKLALALNLLMLDYDICDSLTDVIIEI